MQDTGNYYLINHLVLFTGLTDRTIRNYIASGILQGEKTNGIWHFTPEQVEDFIRHPAVRPSILAKKNSIVYDFLLNNKKKQPEACIILDLPGIDTKNKLQDLYYFIHHGNFHNMQFSYEAINGHPRFILKGSVDEVRSLMDKLLAE